MTTLPKFKPGKRLPAEYTKSLIRRGLAELGSVYADGANIRIEVIRLDKGLRTDSCYIGKASQLKEMEQRVAAMHLKLGKALL